MGRTPPESLRFVAFQLEIFTDVLPEKNNVARSLMWLNYLISINTHLYITSYKINKEYTGTESCASIHHWNFAAAFFVIFYTSTDLMFAHRYQTTVTTLQSETIFLKQSLATCVSYVPTRHHGWQDQSFTQNWKLDKKIQQVMTLTNTLIIRLFLH
jgi:hypothetical protein